MTGSRARARALGAGACVALAGAGCPRPAPPLALEPTRIPPAFIALAPGETQRSAAFLTGSTVYLRVKDARTGLRVPRAAIGLQGPTLAGGVSGATYDLSFGPLAPATYRLRVAAPGYVTRVQDVVVASRPTPGERTPAMQVEIQLEPGGAAISGRVTDASSGQPVAGARVYAGAAWAFSGADGSFSLEGLPGGTHGVLIRKTGYAGARADVAAGADVGAVRLDPVPVVVAFPNAADPFDWCAGTPPACTRTVGAALASLRDALRARGAAVVEGESGAATVQVYASPGARVRDRAADLAAWVAGGNKLVVLGEWGGYAGYSPEAAEALLHPAGLAINPDLVRSGRNLDRLDWPEAEPTAPWPFGTGSVGLFEAASVFSIAPAQPVLRAAGGYRIAAGGGQDPVLAAIAPLGDGLVAAAGDTSAWTDANTTGTGPDLGIRENRSYMVNLILW